MCLIAWLFPSEARLLDFQGSKVKLQLHILDPLILAVRRSPWSLNQPPKRALVHLLNFNPGFKCFYTGHISDYPLAVEHVFTLASSFLILLKLNSPGSNGWVRDCISAGVRRWLKRFGFFWGRNESEFQIMATQKKCSAYLYNEPMLPRYSPHSDSTKIISEDTTAHSHFPTWTQEPIQLQAVHVN